MKIEIIPRITEDKKSCSVQLVVDGKEVSQFSINRGGEFNESLKQLLIGISSQVLGYLYEYLKYQTDK